MLEFPEKERENLLLDFAEQIEIVLSEQNLTMVQAARDVALDWLGYNSPGDTLDDEGHEVFSSKTDGPSDRGLDLYSVENNFAEIVQTKMFEMDVRQAWETKTGVDGLKDIPRIASYLREINEPAKNQNKQVQSFQKRILSKLRQIRENKDKTAGSEDIFTFRIVLLIGARGLTQQAQEEFENYKKTFDVIEAGGVECLVEFKLITLEQILGERWKARNSEWLTKSGKKNFKFECKTRSQIITDTRVKVFFARAIDLINAFEDFGQRIFETNVRCQIKRSSVNKKIAQQISTERGIKEFYLLNNGITILADSISTSNDKAVFIRPGIVNGLQTVTTLSGAYSALKSSLKAVFDEECYVLVRAYEKQAIQNVNKLVIATNNQNLMEPRNLKSNEPVQIDLERQFAREGWFYERKQFAFDAFKADPDRWPSLHRGKVSDFTLSPRKYRVADNLQVAQSWLAFIGLTNEAMHQKADIFSETGGYYERVFEQRANQHAANYDFNTSKANLVGKFDEQTPPHKGLLCAYLLYKAAKMLTPSNAKHRQAMEAKLGLTASNSKEERDQQLIQNDHYLVGLIKSTSSFIYVELAGNILFKKFGTDIYQKFTQIINDTDLSTVSTLMNVSAIENELETLQMGKSSFVALSWALFNDVLLALVTDPGWKASYLQASSRPRLMYARPTREKISEIVSRWDAQSRAKRVLRYDWAVYQQEGSGIADMILPEFKS